MNGVSQTVLNEKVLSNLLARVGYQRIRGFTYRADSSNADVEHFLYVSVYGQEGEFLTAHFGMRNPTAERFSIRKIREYGGNVYSVFRHDAAIDCTNRFSLGRLGNWRPRWSLYISENTKTESVQRFKSDIQRLLLPVTTRVTSPLTLMELLTRDEEPCPWFVTNGAIRAAHIVSVARQLDAGAEEIHAMLRPRYRWISEALRSGMDSSAYLDHLISDCTDAA